MSASDEKAVRPRVICLCGSTRFIEQFATATWVLERRGFIVLGCTLLPMWFCGVASHFGEATGTKEQCDEHHRRKIDLADEVLVLDIGGYIGESTRGEIEYAAATSKPVRYVSADPNLLLEILPEQPPAAPEPRLCTTNGRPVEEVRATQTNATGQYDGYIVLCEDERQKGFVRPYRDRYQHRTCGTITTMGRALSETYARDPTFYGATFCVGCNRHLPVAEFVWSRDGQQVGS